MYRILLAIDGSDHSVKVIDEVITIAQPLNAEVTVLNVTGEFDFKTRISVHMSDDYWVQIKKNLKEQAENVVEAAANKLSENGIPVKTEVVVGQQSPSDVICKMADEGKYNLLVLGSKGLRGIQEAFLGSVSNKVAHCTKTNVLIIK